MKKTVSLLLAVLLCLLLCACGLDAPTTLGDEIALPDDGVVSAQTLDDLRAQRKVVTLRGETDGFAYTWTVFGTEICEPKDCCFALKQIRLGERRVKLVFRSQESFGFASLLTVFLPRAFNADVAAVYHTHEREENFVCAASVTETETGGALSFSVADPTGVYYLVPLKSAAPQPTEQDEPEPETTAPAATSSLSVTAPTTTVPAAQTQPAPTSRAAQTTTQKTTATTSAPQRQTTTAAPATTAATTITTTTTAPQTLTCTFSVECGTVFQHLDDLEDGKLDALPPDGVILPLQSVSFTEGESVFDVLQRLCRKNKIPMESSYVPLYGTAYVEGIGNLYEFDCGEGSGWMYRVNGNYPNFGCSRYILQDSDTVEFRYTCDLGADIGGRNEFTS